MLEYATGKVLLPPPTKNLGLNCIKSVRIWSFFGSYFAVFGLNTERYRVSLRTMSKCRKVRTKKTPNTDTFHAVKLTRKLSSKAIQDIYERSCD